MRDNEAAGEIYNYFKNNESNIKTDNKFINDVLNLMILGRDWYYNKLIDIQKDIEKIENLKIELNTTLPILAIEKTKYEEKIEEATKTIDHFKKVHALH